MLMMLLIGEKADDEGPGLRVRRGSSRHSGSCSKWRFLRQGASMLLFQGVLYGCMLDIYRSGAAVTTTPPLNVGKEVSGKMGSLSKPSKVNRRKSV